MLNLQYNISELAAHIAKTRHSSDRPPRNDTTAIVPNGAVDNGHSRPDSSINASKRANREAKAQALSRDATSGAPPGDDESRPLKRPKGMQVSES